uniref:Uncharacterized protein n=1 Tax=Oryza rufipogon TaxID=4529 RepID=A0A0E0R834_ORYRU
MVAPRQCADSGGDGGDDGDLLERDAPLPLALSVLHDLLGVAAFAASHPLHAAYALFFARHLLALACFFSPLLATTALLLAVLVTVAPCAGARRGGDSPPEPCSLGWTFGIAVGALRAELRPDQDGAGGGAVALLAQLCSFVLGPGDAASVLRVGEIMGELCDTGDSCLILEHKPAVLFDHTELELPWHQAAIDAQISMDQEVLDEIKDGIEEKKVVLEDLNQLSAPHFSSENCSSRSDTSVQDIQRQSFGSSSDGDGFSDGVEEKRLECDPVSVEIKKCEPPAKSLSSVSRRILQWEAQASGNFKKVLDEMEENSVDFSLEKASFLDFKECNKLDGGAYTEKCEVEEIASVAESGMHQEEQKASFLDFKECNKLDGGAYTEKCEVEEISSVAESGMHQEEQVFKDVKECMQSEAETCTEKCSKDQQSEESVVVVQSEEEWQEENLKIVLPELEMQDQEYKDVEPVKELQDQEYKFLQPEEEEEQQEQDSENDAQPEEQLQEQDCDNGVQPEEEEESQEHEMRLQESHDDQEEEFKDAADQESPREDPLRPSTSIARRVHSRTSSEHLLVVGEGSPRKEKEWKRTLACKLYEERMQLKLCRDRAVVESSSDNMDMLWEAYEVGGGGGAATSTKGGASKAKRKQERATVERKQEHATADEEDDDDDGDEEEGSVRQLCCLQALKFSTRKMSFGGGGGKPSLAKISKVLRRVAALSRSGSRRSTKG